MDLSIQGGPEKVLKFKIAAFLDPGDTEVTRSLGKLLPPVQRLWALPSSGEKGLRLEVVCSHPTLLTGAEKLLHHSPFHGSQPLVQVAYPVHERLLQGVVVQLVQVRYQILLRTVQEPAQERE